MIKVKQPSHHGGEPMETLMKIFAPMLVFVYHCFDRIVVNGYLSMLSRPGNLVYFFSRSLVCHASLKKSCPSGRTIISVGSNPMPGITTFRFNGPKRTFARRIMCSPGWRRWQSRINSAFFLFLKVWSKVAPSGRSTLNTPTKTRTTASSKELAAGLLTIISTSATK